MISSHFGIADDERTLIDRLLAEQQTLVPVVRFARAHSSPSPPWEERAGERRSVPATARLYRDLIPLSRPKPGQQYAFEVDLDQCSGCKACVTACHNLNGLDEEETWRSVGVLYGNAPEGPFQQAVTASCHHCVDPGCLTGCPVNAYDKDPLTGIVRHLDDQCIGCQYCVLKCPYDVPKYNSARGIVRKCDMCSSRLEAGEPPACVQGCPNEAIRITIINQRDQVDYFRGVPSSPPGRKVVLPPHDPPPHPDPLLQGGEGSCPSGKSFVPDPRITVPTTRYLSKGRFPQQTSAESLRPAPAHMPLVWMLSLTQLGVGGFVWLAILSCTRLSNQNGQNLLAAESLTSVLTGLLVSLFHLGRPHLAWRAVLNLRTSWMSREVALFLVFTIAAVLHVALRAEALMIQPSLGLQTTTAWLSAITGIAAVFSSVMIYHDTHRVFWNIKPVSLRFFGTTLLLGTSLAILQLRDTNLIRFGALLMVIVTAAKLIGEHSILRKPRANESLKRSAGLMKGALHRFTIARLIFGVLGGFVCPLLLVNSPDVQTLAIVAAAALLFLFLAELLERFLFFTAVAPDRMPQGVT